MLGYLMLPTRVLSYHIAREGLGLREGSATYQVFNFMCDMASCP